MVVTVGIAIGERREPIERAEGRPQREKAEQYGQLFRLFRKYADIIARVSFWDLHDGQSWLNGFPWRRVNYPLLFDRAGQPKPAFDAVLTALQP